MKLKLQNNLKWLLFVFSLLFFSNTSNAQIIISQVYEGASNNKWIEVTNVGTTTIDLASPVQYKLAYWNITGSAGNGAISGNPTNAVNMTGTLAPGGKYLMRNSSASATVPHATMPTANASNTNVAGFNGNDAIAIITGTNTVVDAFGVGINNVDISYHRNFNVVNQNATFTVSEWTTKTLAEVAAADATMTEYISTHLYSSSSISVSGTLASLVTTYGTVSANTSFDVGGTDLTAGITVTPPLGFEVSTLSDFSSNVGNNATPIVIGTGGTIPATTVYVRLMLSPAGNYNGNIVLSSTGVSSVNVPANAVNTINPLALTITGITANDKTFDNTTTATLSGTPTLVGVLVADEPNVTLGGTPLANFNDAAVGNNKPVTVSGYTISGSAAGNYSLTQPTGLTASILPSGLQDQTITFDPLAPVTYGVAPFNLTATASSGLTVTYTSSDDTIASVSGNTVTVHNVGTVVITAQQAGDASYNAANDVGQSLLINPKELTILGADAQDKPYDGTTTATLTGTLDGVISPDVVVLNLSANFDDANVGTDKPVTSNSTLTGADAGKYTLTQPTGLTADIVLGTCSVSGTGTIGWNFTDGVAPSTDTAVALSTDISRGNNNGGATALIFTNSTSTGYAGASGTQNIGAAAFTGGLNTESSTYFEFTLSPESGYNFTLTGLSFGSRSTSTGPQAYALRSSLDNYASDIATGTLANNSTWSLNTPTTVSTTSNGAAVVFRLYGYNGTGSAAVNSANWRVDDLALQISAIPTSALSSPATATTCSGDTFTYTATTNYPGATITWTRDAVAGVSNPAVTTPQTTNPSEVLVNTTALPVDVVYAFTITTATCTLTQNITVTVNNCSSEVNLKLFIEAYYQGAGLMRSVRNNQDGVSDLNEVEAITVELHDAQAPYTLLHSTTAMLLTDGTAAATFDTAPNGLFYIAVKNSNAVQTWSAEPQTIGSTPLAYDFSSSVSSAYGDNQIEVETGVFAFYSGDLNQDESVDNSDGVDLTNDIINSEFGVKITDLNGDGSVDNSDAPFFDNNSNNSIFSNHP